MCGGPGRGARRQAKGELVRHRGDLGAGVRVAGRVAMGARGRASSIRTCSLDPGEPKRAEDDRAQIGLRFPVRWTAPEARGKLIPSRMLEPGESQGYEDAEAEAPLPQPRAGRAARWLASGPR